MRLRFDDFNVVVGSWVECVTLGCDAVPVQLLPLPVFIPIQFMDFWNGTFQVMWVQRFESLNNFIYFIVRKRRDRFRTMPRKGSRQRNGDPLQGSLSAST